MMTNYLLAYFILSALVAALVAAQEYEGLKRLGWVVLLVALGPVLAVGQVALDALEWLDKYGQVKTFWHFLFNRKRMIRTTEELETMHRITVRHRATSSLHHRLWRLAERCYFIVNDYRPPVS